MKILWSLLPAASKAILQVVIFFISLGWASYGAILLIVKAEGREIKAQVMEVRRIDIEHLDKRFDDVISEIRKTNQ